MLLLHIMLKRLIPILLFSPFFIFGQNTDSLQTSATKIEMDEKVDALLNRHIKLNKQPYQGVATGVMGWRLQLCFAGGREDARKLRIKFQLDFPEYKDVYEKHGNPYFKVTIGNFYTKLQAKKIKNEIRKKYCSYIVPSKIVIYD